MFHFGKKAFEKRKAQKLTSNLKQVSDVKHRTSFKNCSSCRFIVECQVSKKSSDYLCNKFEWPVELEEADYLSLLTFDEVAEEKELEQVSIDNIEHMMERAIKDQEAGIQTDFTLEDEDIPLAKNFVEFFFDKRFETELKPFAKQVQVATDLLEEVCWNPTCTDSKYACDVPVDATIDDMRERITYLEHGICPKCQSTRFDQWSKYGRNKSDTLAFICGQRAGKDFLVGFISAYQDHRILKLRSPAKALNIAPGTVLHETFTGTTFGQAKKATFEPYVNTIERSAWFKEYHEMLDYVGQKKGKKLYDVGKESISWNHHGLFCSVASPDVRNLRGVARIRAAVTELGWFFTKSKGSVRLDPDEIMNALSRSFLTVRAGYRKCLEQGKFDVPGPLMLIASSPSNIKDKAMRMLKSAAKDTNICAYHLSTYQVNPDIKEEDLASEKAADIIAYRRDYLAIPPSAVSAFISDRRIYEACINPKRVNAVRGKNTFIKAPSGAKMTSGKIVIEKNPKKVDTKTPKVLAIDSGVNNNSFALTVAHVIIEEDDNGIETTYTVVDAMYEVIPYSNKAVNYADVFENIILPICEELNVQLVVIDRYAAGIQMKQTLEVNYNIPGITRSVKYADFKFFKQCLYNTTVDIPMMEMDYKKAEQLSQINYPHSFDGTPIAHSLIQATTVEDLMGKKIDKGEGFTDDLFYSLVLAHAVCNDANMQEQFLGDALGEEAKVDEVVGVRVGYEGQTEQIQLRGGSSLSNNNTMNIGVSVSYGR